MLREIFEGIKEGVGEMGAELSRLGIQGEAELAGALFAGSSFVPYGRGQNPAQEQSNEVAPPAVEAPVPEQSAGMEM